MERREKILAIAAGTLGALFLGNFVFNHVKDSIQQAKNDVINAEKKFDQRDLEEREQYNKLMDLRDWQDISLPSEVSAAKNEYQTWLQSLPRFSNLIVRPTGDAKRIEQGDYSILTYQLTGQGTLEDVSDFLFNFYNTNLMHRIQSMSLNPATSSASDNYSEQLQITIQVEAISMGDASAVSQLATVPTPDYWTEEEFVQLVRDSILDRNLFNYNAAPEVAEIRTRTVSGDEQDTSFRVSATDPEGRPLRFALKNAPRGMTINSSTGEITFAPRDREEDKTYEGIVVLVDDMGLKQRQVSQTFSVKVEKAVEPEVVAEDTFDPTAYAYITAFFERDGEQFLIIDDRAGGRSLQLKENETFELGGIDFTLMSINWEQKQVTLAAAGKERVLTRGDSLEGFGEGEFTGNGRGFGNRGGFGGGNRGGNFGRGNGRGGGSNRGRGGRGGELPRVQPDRR